MITITRFSINKCRIFSDNEKEFLHAKKKMSVEIDGAEHSELFQEGRWDGTHKFVNNRGEMGIGLVPELLGHLDTKKIEYKIVDFYKKKSDELKVKIDKRMREYQAEAIRVFFSKNIGTIKVPPRGGKTFVAAEMSRIFLNNYDTGNFIHVVDTEDLFKQAVKDFSKYLGVTPDEIGQINSKKTRIGRINVAMVQTLVSGFSKKNTDKQKKKEFVSFMNKVAFLSIDEVHENSSKLRLAIYRKCRKVKYIASFSGTPKKQFGLIENMKMEEFFGGIIYEIPKSTLQEQGYLAMDKVFLIHVDHKKHRFKCDGYRETLTKYIHTNEYRNDLLEQVIDVCISNKWKTLVLFNSVDHGKLLSKNTGLPFISGKDKGTVRDSEKEKFLSGKGKVLIASNIFKKGITLPEAEVVIIGDGGLEGTNITQKYSRVLGTTDDKKRAIVIDFMDSGVDYFSDHSLNRLEVYDEEMGADRIEVYEDYQINEMGESMFDWINFKDNG